MDCSERRDGGNGSENVSLQGNRNIFSCLPGKDVKKITTLTIITQAPLSDESSSFRKRKENGDQQQPWVERGRCHLMVLDGVKEPF